ncbi:amidohydrolase [Hellea balneolensis]|uniref:amidohydrolase n=1 Tax=Hellea balneolensis TaxID=287478 RepID=UPI00138B18C5|nr:amidohydrolase family protein [Hellea balneolensis]
MKRLLLCAGLAFLTACSNSSNLPGKDITIYTANHILTVYEDMPNAEAIAVNSEGNIVAIGDLKPLSAQLKGADIDNRFEGKTITPGLIDPHIHMVLGSMMYGLDFIPPWDMETPKGTVKGLPDKASLMAKIAEFESIAAEGPLILYGYHNLVQGDLTRQDLDLISKTRPIFIWHFSGHDFYLNSAAIDAANLTPALAEKFHGVGLDDNGELNGRIYEDAGLALFQTVGPILLAPEHIQRGWEGYEAIFARSGVTSVAEMGYGIFGRALEDNYIKAHYSAEDNYNLYLVPEHRAFTQEFQNIANLRIIEMARNKDAIPRVLPQVKLFTDAAFYSQTMKMSAPGYIGGQSKGTDGLWVTEPQDLASLMRRYWDVGLDIHIHSNGDAAQDSTLKAFSEMKPGEGGQRLVIEHGGLFTPEQIKTAAELGVGISAASHYVKYMGEDYKEAIGDKTDFITPLASAIKAGIHTTVHSDAPLAPPQPLKAASVHMTRETRQGGVSNADEKITREQALKAITLDAAWSLGLEDEIGSLEVGKRADFAILETNPLTTAPENWPDIEVWGVVLAGDIRPVQK